MGLFVPSDAAPRNIDRLSSEIAELVESRMASILTAYEAEGRSIDELGSAEDLAERMVATIPKPSPWDSALGPFYRTQQVCRLLGGISRQAVMDRLSRRTLLGLKTRDGLWVYPSFQFLANGRLVSDLGELLHCFDPALIDEWTLAAWFVSPQIDLEQRSVADLLREGGRFEDLLSLAQDAASRFDARPAQGSHRGSAADEAHA